MKRNSTFKANYLFSFLPVLALLLFLPTSFTPIPLPCGFTERSVVPSADAGAFGPGLILATGGVIGTVSSISAGNNELSLQGDGNLVLYSGSGSKRKVLWSTGTNLANPNGLTFRLIFQSDGNLLLYSISSLNLQATLLWSSGIYTTCAHSYNPLFCLQTDGNFVMLYPKYDSSGAYLGLSVLGDTGTAGFTSSPHQGIIN